MENIKQKQAFELLGENLRTSLQSGHEAGRQITESYLSAHASDFAASLAEEHPLFRDELLQLQGYNIEIARKSDSKWAEYTLRSRLVNEEIVFINKLRVVRPIETMDLKGASLDSGTLDQRTVCWIAKIAHDEIVAHAESNDVIIAPWEVEAFVAMSSWEAGRMPAEISSNSSKFLETLRTAYVIDEGRRRARLIMHGVPTVSIDLPNDDDELTWPDCTWTNLDKLRAEATPTTNYLQ